MICFSIGYLLIESVRFDEKSYFAKNQDAALDPVSFAGWVDANNKLEDD